MWAPGTAATRLPVIAEMFDAAQASCDDDLVAEAHLLRAAALLELGERAGAMSCSPMSPWQASWVMPVAAGVP